MASVTPSPEPMSREACLAALAKNPLAAALTDAGVERLLDATEVVQIGPGSTVLREGDASADMFFVLDGEAALRRNDFALQPIGPGGHFGALGMFTGRPRTVTVTATTTLTLAHLTRARWEDLAARDATVAVSVLTALLGHVREDLTEMTDSLGALIQGRSLPRAREVTATLPSGTRLVATGTPLRRLLPRELEGQLVVAGLLNEKPVSLNTPLLENAAVAPLTMSDTEGRHVWIRSLGLVLLEAARSVAPGVTVRMGPSRGPAQWVEVEGSADLAKLAGEISTAMRRIIDADSPIRQEQWAVEEAQSHFRGRGWTEAERLLTTTRLATVPLVTCGDLYALGMGPLLPSTGALRGWSLHPHEDGLVLDFGERGSSGVGSPLLPLEPRDAMTRQHRAWLDGMGVSSVGAFNDLCISGGVAQLIRTAEGFHEKRIGTIADDIASHGDRIRIITIAGPSSSGKTTFIKRLTTQLIVNGLRPVGLSLDDYYVDRELTVRDEKGDYDFEALEAINLELLQEQVASLLAGATVPTARYDFVSGKGKPAGGPPIQLRRGDVLMLEGIHGLNPELLGSIPGEGELYRIFVHPATTLPFDRLSRTSITDLRLLRRIVRDRHQRGYHADQNILRWPSVQRGERLHIFPFMGEADAVFDTSLIYEPSVLKVYAERYLLEVPRSSHAYATAWRLRLFIDRFVSIYPDHVPPTSIIREFIGGSGFEY